MHIVVISKGQEEFVEKMISPIDLLFVFDRCDPVEGVRFKHNIEGEGFLAGYRNAFVASGLVITDSLYEEF